MDADQLVSFVLDKKWLALAILVIGYVTRLLSDESKFPLSVPARWRPVIIVVLGQLLGGLVLVQGGASWKVAIATGLAVSFATMGLFDLVVKAIFDGSPPWWIDIFALVFPKKDSVPKPPKLPTGLGVLAIVFCIGAGSVAGINVDDIEVRSPIEMVACKPANGPNDADASSLVEAGTQVANDICSLIDGIDDNGAVRTICATVEEIADVVSFILTLRDARDGGASPASCAYLPKTAFCATSPERAQAILFLVRARTARLSLDAGAQ